MRSTSATARSCGAVSAGADVLHIHCQAAGATLVDRMWRRVASGERHPIHHHADAPSLIADGVFAPPSLNVASVTVPTDDFGSAHYRRAVEVALDRASELTQRGR